MNIVFMRTYAVEVLGLKKCFVIFIIFFFSTVFGLYFTDLTSFIHFVSTVLKLYVFCIFFPSKQF